MAAIILQKLPGDGTATTRICALLEHLGDSYEPPLRTIVDVKAYAAKLAAYAETIVATSATGDVGIISIYVNATPALTAFISTIGVEQKMAGSGLAERLLKVGLDMAAKSGFSKVRLEVGTRNLRAVRFYQKHGFDFVGENIVGRKYDSRLMEKQLIQKLPERSVG